MTWEDAGESGGSLDSSQCWPSSRNDCTQTASVPDVSRDVVAGDSAALPHNYT